MDTYLFKFGRGPGIEFCGLPMGPSFFLSWSLAHLRVSGDCSDELSDCDEDEISNSFFLIGFVRRNVVFSGLMLSSCFFR